MSFQVNSACYETAEAAAQVTASSQVGTIVPHGSTSYAVNAAASDATSITYTLTPVAGGAALTLVTPFAPQPCALLGTQDAVDMGWLVIAAWIGAWGIKFIAQAVHDWGNQNGNT